MDGGTIMGPMRLQFGDWVRLRSGNCYMFLYLDEDGQLWSWGLPGTDSPGNGWIAPSEIEFVWDDETKHWMLY